MKSFARPRVVVSQCLGFAACRYNGQMIEDPFVKKLTPHVEFIPVCPEVEIGLGVPREPIRLVTRHGEPRLLQPATGLDLTDAMRRFANSFLDALGEVDGFILKNRSPSCGIKDVKVYADTGPSPVREKGAGMFGGIVLERFPHLAIEDEGRLTNLRLRDHFLTKLFTLASFRQIRTTESMKELIQFHSENKYLLMAYSQKELKILGKLVANLEKQPFGIIIEQYAEHLWAALARPPRYQANINVLHHILGHVSNGLTSQERAFFLEIVEQYRHGRIPLAVATTLIRAWSIRLEAHYLLQQTFLEPYPPELIDPTDSGSKVLRSAQSGQL